ncbi:MULTISPECIES: dynamin family protein [Bacillus]|uniref:dynamin family protein n=1 Tax=Bacillus TaxID=1386 RepID=UPI00098A47E6|nr:dynamin family protein [Bacillus sonorensis]
MAHINIKDDLAKRAGAVFSELKKNGDHKRAAQLAGIIRKWLKREVYIALTGHYSAGKSSLVNALLQEDVLPTSPIPTSANLVLVRRGELKTALHTTDGKYAELKGAYDKQKVQVYCKDGSQIEMVEIEGPFSGLEPHAVLIDTPGIDSTDDAHFLSASSILHQADALFYVVHYNHVHSEENINFLRSIKEKIPNIYFIVNQVDRHDETETDFASYKHEVLNMLKKEGIGEDHLFFTSVIDIEHPLNEFKRLRDVLKRLQHQAGQQLDSYTEQKVVRLMNEHAEMLITDEDSSLAEETASQANIVESLNEQLAKSADQRLQAEEQIRKEIQTIIQNANVTPFHMRELAASYLESTDKGFKKGFIFSKTKTLEEKQKRKKAFLSDVQNRVQAEIDWHIIEVLKTYMNRYEVKSDDLLQQTLQFTTDIGEDHLLRSLKKGASLTSEYVLNYTKDLAENIRREAKRSAQPLIDQFRSLLEQNEMRAMEAATGKYEEEKAKLAALEERLKQQQQSYQKAKRLWELWENGGDGTDQGGWYAAEKAAVLDSFATAAPCDSGISQKTDIAEKTQIQKMNVSEYMEKFAELARHLEGIPILQKQREAFLQKTERLQSRQFTLALFGAFSSGKSSFANALCGQKVLPSSPTPTTATINKITKPKGAKQDGTADVSFKTEAEIAAELDQLLDGKISALKRGTLAEKLEHLLKKGKLDDDERLITEHFAKAYQRFRDFIISQDILTIASGELKPYVAEEETACVVREVTVYLHTPVTDKGITIVDTPGANSVNKRHTELAFQYMKDADALLYLTYYQHAFSKADRSFLRKLGLIKDAFSLDKMFFILNAADLAESSQELRTVEEYVRGELLKEGIQHPHFYHVSSKQELSGQSSSFNHFGFLKKALDDFIENGLTKAAVDQLIYEGKKLCETVIQLRRSFHRSAQEAEAEKKRIAKAYEAACTAIAEVEKGSAVFQMIEKDIEEQFYYMKQRLSFYAHDLFKAAIHPGLQNGSWLHNLQKALKSCLKEYAFECVQELKALDIRLEQEMISITDKQWIAAIKQRIADNPYFSVHIAPESPEGNSAEWAEPPADEGLFKDELKPFKAPKSFFQQNGKARLIEALTSKLSEITADWVEEQKQAFFSRAEKSARHLEEAAVQAAFTQISEQKETYFHEPLESGDRDKIEKAYTSAGEWLSGIDS